MLMIILTPFIVALNEEWRSYCIGSNQEKTNIEIAKYILDKLKPSNESYIKQISLDDRLS